MSEPTSAGSRDQVLKLEFKIEELTFYSLCGEKLWRQASMRARSSFDSAWFFKSH